MTVTLYGIVYTGTPDEIRDIVNDPPRRPYAPREVSSECENDYNNPRPISPVVELHESVCGPKLVLTKKDS